MVETPIEQKQIEKDTVSFHFMSKIDEFNCMEYSNDFIIQLIVKTIIYKRGTIEEKFKILKEDPRIKKYSEHTFLNIFNKFEDYKIAYLEVRENNFAAIDLYNKFGFQQISLRKEYYSNGEDAIVMIKHHN